MAETSLEQLSRLLEQVLDEQRGLRDDMRAILACLDRMAAQLDRMATSELVGSLCTEGEALNRQAAERAARERGER